MLIEANVPEIAARWGRLSAAQREWLEERRDDDGYPAVFGSVCAVDEGDPRENCHWWLPHPGVYAWSVRVRYESQLGVVADLAVLSGVNQFRRLLDHACVSPVPGGCD